MNLSDWHALATIFAVVAFLAVCWWALSPTNKKRFEKDAALIFDGEHIDQNNQSDTTKREN